MDVQEYLNIIISEEYKLIYELVKNGNLSNYHYLVELFDTVKDKLISMNDSFPKEIYDLIINDYLKTVKAISLLVPGLSTGIKDEKSGVSIYTYDGKVNDDMIVDENTRFDLASLTKLFTVIETLKLNEEGKFDLNRLVSDYKDGKYELDISIEKMAKFYYDLRTDGRLDDKYISLEEFQRRLLATKIMKDNTFVYSDIPFIILKDILPDSDCYFHNYFNEGMNLLDTSYDISFGNLTGMREGEKVNDSKARIMESYEIYPGHAGIFSTSKDLIKLFDNLNNGFLSNESIIRMITPAISTPILLNLDGTINLDNGNVKRVNRGMGVYYKHPEGIRISDIPDVMSDEAFAITGFTGTWATFDLKNKLTANFLANPFSIKGEREIVIADDDFKILNCNNYFEDGVKFKVFEKNIKILNNDGMVINSVPFTRITNVLKEESIYTLLKLRFVKNVLMRKAELEQSGVLDDLVHKTFERTKMVRK